MSRYVLFAVMLSMFAAVSARGEGSDGKDPRKIYVVPGLSFSADILREENLRTGSREVHASARATHKRFGISLGVYGAIPLTGDSSTQGQGMLDPNSPAVLAQQAAARERLTSAGVGKDFRVGLSGRQGLNVRWMPDVSSEFKLETKHDHWLGYSVLFTYKYEGLLF